MKERLRKISVNQDMYHFFDQNVIAKMTKIDQASQEFQENVKQTFLKTNINQVITPFSFLEFAGIQSKDIFNKILYKEQKLSEYTFKYDELKSLTSNLKNQIREQVPKDFLRQKLLNKKNLNKVGEKLINRYFQYYINDDFYNHLIHNLYLDRLSQLNTSKFSKEEKDDFNKIHFYPSIMRNICDKKRTLGAFRVIKKMDEDICQKIKNQETENTNLNKNRKKLKEILDNLKLSSNSDLVDCELIHLACFGYDDYHCRCYTTDEESIIRERLNFYITGVFFLENWFYEYLPIKRPDWNSDLNEHLPKERPDWKCGRIFILNKNTGKKIKTILVRKIYDKIKKNVLPIIL